MQTVLVNAESENSLSNLPSASDEVVSLRRGRQVRVSKHFLERNSYSDNQWLDSQHLIRWYFVGDGILALGLFYMAAPNRSKYCKLVYTNLLYDLFW